MTEEAPSLTEQEIQARLESIAFPRNEAPPECVLDYAAITAAERVTCQTVLVTWIASLEEKIASGATQGEETIGPRMKGAAPKPGQKYPTRSEVLLRTLRSEQARLAPHLVGSA